MNNFRENCVRDLKRLFHLLYTLTYFVSLVPLKIYDILHGTEFSGIDNSEDKEGRYTYYPSPVFSFPRLRRYIRRNMQNGRGSSVLDIGCGKGFVLLFFSGLSFDKVAGIEYDEKLCRIAKRNLRKTSGKVKVYRADAQIFRCMIISIHSTCTTRLTKRYLKNASIRFWRLSGNVRES